jgi:hypothetical protein
MPFFKEGPQIISFFFGKSQKNVVEIGFVVPLSLLHNYSVIEKRIF